MSILAEIIAQKQLEVAESIARRSIERVQASAGRAPAPRNLAATVKRGRCPAIIAEIKRASPSKGVIREDLDPLEAAKHFTVNGAAALSVLTDEKFFQGKLEYISQIRRDIPDTPILRKDFIIDPYQVWETRAAQADAMLLIVAAFDGNLLPREQLKTLYQEGRKAGLDILLEVHNEQELKQALEIFGPNLEDLPYERVLLGINNRNLKTFETSLSVTEKLLPLIPSNVREQLGVISESGIKNAADIKRLHECGAEGYLIGEHLVKEGLVGQNLSRLIKQTKKMI